MAWRPDCRSTGIMPSAGRRRRVFQLSRYSALPTKLTGRRMAMMIATESKNETWLAAMMAGPSAGTCSSPSTRTHHSARYTGQTATLAAPASQPVRAAPFVGGERPAPTGARPSTVPALAWASSAAGPRPAVSYLNESFSRAR